MHDLRVLKASAYVAWSAKRFRYDPDARALGLLDSVALSMGVVSPPYYRIRLASMQVLGVKADSTCSSQAMVRCREAQASTVCCMHRRFLCALWLTWAGHMPWLHRAVLPSLSYGGVPSAWTCGRSDGLSDRLIGQAPGSH